MNTEKRATAQLLVFSNQSHKSNQENQSHKHNKPSDVTLCWQLCRKKQDHSDQRVKYASPHRQRGISGHDHNKQCYNKSKYTGIAKDHCQRGLFQELKDSVPCFVCSSKPPSRQSVTPHRMCPIIARIKGIFFLSNIIPHNYSQVN